MLWHSFSEYDLFGRRDEYNRFTKTAFFKRFIPLKPPWTVSFFN